MSTGKGSAEVLGAAELWREAAEPGCTQGRGPQGTAWRLSWDSELPHGSKESVSN